MNSSDRSDDERLAEKIDLVSNDFEAEAIGGQSTGQLAKPVRTVQQALPSKLFRNETSGLWLRLAIFSGMVLLFTLIFGVKDFQYHGWVPLINAVPISLFFYFSCTRILKKKEIVLDQQQKIDERSWLKWDKDQWAATAKSLGGTLLSAETFKSAKILVPYKTTYVGIFLYMFYVSNRSGNYVDDEQTIVAIAFKKTKNFQFYVRRSAGSAPKIKDTILGIDDDLFQKLVAKLDLHQRLLKVPLQGVAEIAVLDTLSAENLYGLYPDDVAILRLMFSHKHPIYGTWLPFIYDPATLKELVVLVHDTLEALQELGLAKEEPSNYEPV